MSLIQQQVAHLVEAQTRFTADAVQATAEPVSQSTCVTATLTHRFTFDLSSQQRAGKLPSHVRDAGTRQQAAALAQAQLLQARQDAPAAVSAWAKTEGQTYQRYLPTSAGFLRDPGAFGATVTCSDCKGARRHRCQGCGGQGESTCSTCSGSGSCLCASCAGTMRLPCNACGGRGTDHTGKESCTICSGSRTRICYSCNAGKIGCSRCACSGNITCTHCNGSCYQDCDTCQVTGYQHHIDTVQCTVQHSGVLAFDPDLPADLQQQLHQHLQLEDLPELATLRAGPYPFDLSSDQLEVHFAFDLPWVLAQLQVKDRAYALYGVGPDQHIWDYRNIVGNLLAPDLAALQAAADQASRWTGRNLALRDSLAKFTESEIHLRITDAAAQGQTSSSAALEQDGLVSSDYVHAALAALQQSVRKLQSPALLLSTANLSLVMFALGCLGVFAGATLRYPQWMALIVTLAVGAGLWWATEWGVRWHISGIFPAAVRHRVRGFMGHASQLRAWRIFALPVLAAATVLAFTIAPTWSWVRQAQHDADVAAQYQRSSWNWYNLSRDWLHFTYPDAQWMAAQAQAENSADAPPIHALMYAAWLLRAQDAPTDGAARARAVLDAVHPAHHSLLSWRGLSAMADLALPQATGHAQALAGLQQAADEGLTEAQYEMAEQYATRNGALSLKYLALASSAGHDRANYALTLRYLEGRGVPKDRNQAKHTLSPLNQVPGARELFQQLYAKEMRK